MAVMEVALPEKASGGSLAASVREAGWGCYIRGEPPRPRRVEWCRGNRNGREERECREERGEEGNA